MKKEYLDYQTIKLERFHSCAFCNKILEKNDSMIKVNTNDRTIIEEVFGMIKHKSHTKKAIYICPQCFYQIHKHLEKLESIGWEEI